MSAYGNDSRVTQLNQQSFEVLVDETTVIVYYWSEFAVWRSEKDLASLPPFSTDGHATADEAIRSLIGEPQ